MTKQAIVRALLLFLTFATGIAGAQEGTPPDPRAGQSPSTAAPTSNPPAPQGQPPVAPQGSAAPAPAQPQPPAPQASSNPAPEQAKQNNTSKPAVAEKSQSPQTASNVEITPPVTGPPQTKIIDQSLVGKHAGITGARDPLLDTQPLPKGDPTLIGGVAIKVDRIRSRISVAPYGAKNKMSITIDERTHIYRNGVETTIEHIKRGDHVYFDTVLDGPRVFAKNVRVISETGVAEVRGQITSYDRSTGIVQLRDALSSSPVTFHISGLTHVQGEGTASASDLAKGALVDVIFAPDKSNRRIATEVTVLARPGTNYTFAGVITNVDVRDGVVSVESRGADKVYDIAFDTHSKSQRNSLHVGNTVNITATYDGENYRATSITVVEAKAPSKPRPEDQQ
jgi:hypothetical protein